MPFIALSNWTKTPAKDDNNNNKNLQSEDERNKAV